MATAIIIGCCVVLGIVMKFMSSQSEYRTGQVAKRDLERDGD